MGWNQVKYNLRFVYKKSLLFVKQICPNLKVVCVGGWWDKNVIDSVPVLEYNEWKIQLRHIYIVPFYSRI